MGYKNGIVDEYPGVQYGMNREGIPYILSST